jgi:hypothetical protein
VELSHAIAVLRTASLARAADQDCMEAATLIPSPQSRVVVDDATFAPGFEPAMAFAAALTVQCLSARLPWNETSEPQVGLEPTLSCLQDRCMTAYASAAWFGNRDLNPNRQLQRLLSCR